MMNTLKQAGSMLLLTLLLTQTSGAQDATVKADDGAKLFEAGRRALFQGETEKAIDLLKQAVATDKAAVKTAYRLHLARALRYASKFEEAEPLLEGILKRTPDHVEAAQLFAEILEDQERWKKLIEVLEPLLVKLPESDRPVCLGGAAVV